jgi:hypothetical protein
MVTKPASLPDYIGDGCALDDDSTLPPFGTVEYAQEVFRRKGYLPSLLHRTLSCPFLTSEEADVPVLLSLIHCNRPLPLRHLPDPSLHCVPLPFSAREEERLAVLARYGLDKINKFAPLNTLTKLAKNVFQCDSIVVDVGAFSSPFLLPLPLPSSFVAFVPTDSHSLRRLTCSETDACW